MKPILQLEEWAVFVTEDSQQKNAMLDLDHDFHPRRNSIDNHRRRLGGIPCPINLAAEH